MPKATTTYPPETIGSVMSSKVPTCRLSDSRTTILEVLSKGEWDSVHQIYVIDQENKLRGIIDIALLLKTDANIDIQKIMQPTKTFLHPYADQETAVFQAVKNDIITIPVVDGEGNFLGAVTAHSIIDIMHEEHVEDALLTAGIRGETSIIKLATERTSLIVRSRAPWLVFGLLVGLGLGLISSRFEESLRRTVAIAYFIPVVAYIADSVGTQTEAIAVRALATLKVNQFAYLFKELLVGLVLGLIVGMLGGIGAMLIASSTKIGIVVALSLFVASTMAAVIAALIPIIFKRLGKDPALGSGPLATALQDVISILAYFTFATVLI